MKLLDTDLILNARTGPLAGTTIAVEHERITLGRDMSCVVRLDDPKVSRIHAVVEVTAGKLYLRDNNSTNGSFVNGVRVTRQELHAGDVLQIGASEIHLLQHTDFQSISFTMSDTIIQSSVDARKVTIESLAGRLGGSLGAADGPTQITGVRDSPNHDLRRTQKVLSSIRALFKASAELAKLLPMDQLLDVVGRCLFEVFDGAENLVILMRDDTSKFVPRFASDRAGKRDAPAAISTTVLNRACAEKTTLIANDIGHDDRFSASESIVGFSVKAVICAPLVVGDRVIGALYLDNREKNIKYDDADAEIVTAFASQAAIAIDNARLCDTLQESYHQMLQSLVNAIEAKDPYTMGHTQRVRQYALAIGREMGFSLTHLEKLGMAAELHDIGKIGVREGIINKAGSLTESEYASVKTHVEMGEKILGPIVYLRELLPWIRGHHERWDGSGYPDGAKGEENPLEARILALADAYDAMTSQRSYNKPMTPQQALDRIREVSGKHFDPQVVVAFEAHHQKSGSRISPPTLVQHDQSPTPARPL